MNGHGKVKPVHKKYVVSKPDVLGLKGQKIKEEKGEEGELKTHHMTRKKKKTPPHTKKQQKQKCHGWNLASPKGQQLPRKDHVYSSSKHFI